MKQVESMDDFKGELSSAGSKLVVVDFFATWCGPCKMIAPKLEEMSKEFSDVVFLKVDVDETDDVAAEYDIKAMPTFKFFKNGSVVAEVVGASVDKIRATIEQNK